MSPSLSLYHSNASPNARRVRIYLAERGIAADLIPVDLGAKKQFSKAYTAINPRNVVPSLVLADNTVIGEVPAIIRYLDEAFSDHPINGTTPTEKALVQMWERRMELEGFAPVMEAVRNAAPGLAGRAISGPHAYEQIPALIERGHQRLRDFYDDLEARLAESNHVAGETFSSADITALVTIDFATAALSAPVPETHAAIHRWYAKVRAHHSYLA